jgi:uncharacterized protein YidB (DUF937 family)
MKDLPLLETAMGLLDALVGPMLGSLSGVTDEGHEELVKEVGTLLERVGGLDCLVGLFQQKGLGDLVASWISTGPNLPLSPQQLESVFGSAELQAIAQRLHLPREETSAHLAQLLPQIVDKLTPEGTVPSWGALGGLLGTLE